MSKSHRQNEPDNHRTPAFYFGRTVVRLCWRPVRNPV